MRDRLYIKESYRDSVINPIKDKHILNFDLSGKNIDLYLFAVSLGINSPKDISGARFGYFQIHNNIGTFEKSLFGSLLLGKPENENKVDEVANIELNYNESERCAETGFELLKQKLDKVNWDEEMLEKSLLLELKVLYQTNIKSK